MSKRAEAPGIFIWLQMIFPGIAGSLRRATTISGCDEFLGRLLKKAASIVVSSEQRIDFFAEVAIVSAGVVEITLPFFERSFQQCFSKY